MTRALAIAAHADGSILPVLAHPGARKDAVLGERAGALRVAVTAAPEKGKANVAIQELLARALGRRLAEVSLVSGPTSRQKRFLVAGLDPEELRRRLAALIPDDATPKPTG